MKNFLYHLIRLFLGLSIAGAGVGKLLDIPGFVSVIETYQLYLPLSLMWITAIVVVVFEITLGFWILFGKNLKIPALLSMIMHAGYFVLLEITFLRGIELQNCGCFGVFFPRPLMWYTPLEDLALILVSYLLFYFSTRLSSRDYQIKVL